MEFGKDKTDCDTPLTLMPLPVDDRCLSPDATNCQCYLSMKILVEDNNRNRQQHHNEFKSICESNNNVDRT
jgi:hypothetical protein